MSKQPRPTRRDRRGAAVSKRFDHELARQLSLEEFDEAGLNGVLDTCLRGNDSVWEQLEIRRRHAQLALVVAAEHGAKSGELKRRFAVVGELGFSSADNECGILCYYTYQLSIRGGRKRAINLLREFAAKLDVQHRELGVMRKFLAKRIKDI